MFDPKTRILIVDDHLTMRKIVAKILRELGFTDLTEAADGALAWTALESANPPIGLVVSDWNMPNCTGIDLLKKVRADGRFAKMPFLLVTAEAEAHQVKTAIEAGTDNYIVKPFTKEAFVEKLGAVHKKRCM